MTSHFFNHHIVDLHYYRFGNGPKAMLCFHGYGMHGRQFKVLTERFGGEYTFYGFDLFFHEKTQLKDVGIGHIKKGMSKADFCEIMNSFCLHQSIDHFSIIAYSLGTNYAMVMVESKLFNIDEVFLLAPAFLKIPSIFKILAQNSIANLFFRKILLSKSGVLTSLGFLRKIGFIDLKNYEIIKKEMATAELRYAFYGTVTYLRFLRPDLSRIIKILNEKQIKTFFIFGGRDRAFPAHIADNLLPQLTYAKKVILNEDHDMVNTNLADCLYRLKYDHKS